MVGWPPQLNGHECKQTLGDSDRQESLVCYSPWGYIESDKTQQLNRNNNYLWRGKNHVLLSYFCHNDLGQMFSIFRVHQNHLEDILKLILLGPAPRISETVGPCGAPAFTYPISSQDMLMLPVQGPHFENHWLMSLKLFNELNISVKCLYIYQDQFSLVGF